jgi:hypothetical protein
MGLAQRFVAGHFELPAGLRNLCRQLICRYLGLPANAFVQFTLLGLLFAALSLFLCLPLSFEGRLGQIICPLFGLLAGFDLLGETLGLGFAFLLLVGDEPFHFGLDLAADVGLDALFGLDRFLLSLFCLPLCGGQFLNQLVGPYRLRFGLFYAVFGLEELFREAAVGKKFGFFERAKI